VKFGSKIEILANNRIFGQQSKLVKNLNLGDVPHVYARRLETENSELMSRLAQLRGENEVTKLEIEREYLLEEKAIVQARKKIKMESK